MAVFEIGRAIEILERTPKILKIFLSDLSDNWVYENEGKGSWSPYDIIGHLIHGEKTDWIIRARMILEDGKSKTFRPFDRFAQFHDSRGKSLKELLKDFETFRLKNIEILREMNLSDDDFDKKGIHPDFGEVSLRQLISTWVVHDLGHIRQIARVMAKQYKDELGPWEKYLPVVTE